VGQNSSSADDPLPSRHWAGSIALVAALINNLNRSINLSVVATAELKPFAIIFQQQSFASKVTLISSDSSFLKL